MTPRALLSRALPSRALLALTTTALVVAGLAGCGTAAVEEAEGDGSLIGVSLPNRATERWIADGDTIKAFLEAQGYTVDLQYASDDIPTQVTQVEAMINAGAEALIVAPIDGTTLSGVLEPLAGTDFPVIAYDRLIRNSAEVDYFVTFDQSTVGQQQAWTFLEGLGLTTLDGTAVDTPPEGPFSIELFAGPVDDAESTVFFDGALAVLQPYLDAGTIVIGSGQSDLNAASTKGWDAAAAETRMTAILGEHYSADEQLHGVLSPLDSISRGIAAALTAAGHAPGEGWPVITGGGAELDSLKAILAGEQYATIFTDTRELAEAAGNLAIAGLTGATPTVTDEETYDNGVMIVPTLLLHSRPVTGDNLERVLVDSGYWAAEDLGLER